MTKAVFLDRDGTIIYDKHYIYRLDDLEFIPGAIRGMKRLQDAGYLLIVITNQSGIARGFFGEKEYQIFMDFMKRRLLDENVLITADYYCPHHPDAVIERYRTYCNCRKPKMQLFEMAVNDFNIDIHESYAIGDRMRDLSLCQSTQCRGYLIGKTEDTQTIWDVKRGEYNNIEYCTGLWECALEITGADSECALNSKWKD